MFDPLDISVNHNVSITIDACLLRRHSRFQSFDSLCHGSHFQYRVPPPPPAEYPGAGELPKVLACSRSCLMNIEASWLELLCVQKPFMAIWSNFAACFQLLIDLRPYLRRKCSSPSWQGSNRLSTEMKFCVRVGRCCLDVPLVYRGLDPCKTFSISHWSPLVLSMCLRCPAAPYAKGTHIYLVFEFCEHDLAGLLSNPAVKFALSEIKTVMQQLLNGVFFLHKHRILHRDIKAANILITKHGSLKLADFGLARAFSVNNKEKNRYTSRVVTLWYRPPELLLGERNYGPPIDMWGVGCIMAEMWTRAPILQGRAEIHQLQLINCLCGTIDPTVS